MTNNGQLVDTQELLGDLRHDLKWHELPSTSSTCIHRKYRIAIYTNLVLSLSIMLNFLSLNIELLGTPQVDIDAIPEGLPRYVRAPITLLAFMLTVIIFIVGVVVFVKYTRLLVCHSHSLQVLFHKLGVDSPEFPDKYRKSAVAPLSNAVANRLLFILTIVTSIITPFVIHQYSGTLFSEIGYVVAILSFGIPFLFGGLMSEWEIRRSFKRYERMTDIELRGDAELLIERDNEKVKHWLQSKVRWITGKSVSDEVLESLVSLWYEEYIYRDFDNPGLHNRIMNSITEKPPQWASRAVLLIGLVSTIAWVINSLLICLLHPPMPSI